MQKLLTYFQQKIYIVYVFSIFQNRNFNIMLHVAYNFVKFSTDGPWWIFSQKIQQQSVNH